MTSSAEHHDNEMRSEPSRRHGRGPRHRPRLGRTAPVTAALVGLALMVAGCGGSNAPGSAGGGGAGGSSSGTLARFEAYARCMRSHGISDFPDPTTSPGGGVAIQLNGGPGSDLNKRNPRFKAANQVCRSLEPGGSGVPQQSAQKIAAEVKWARCMRSHGLPSFPDPNGQGAFDRSKFDESTPAFQSASKACQSLMNAVGPIPVHP
jgi:hypothetical protein